MPEHPDSTEIESTWHEFHRVVNMTSEELADWLRTRSAGEEAEELPDAAGPALGRHVLAILGKRKGDLTEDDVRIAPGDRYGARPTRRGPGTDRR